jgi:hypothetical protein
MPTGQDPRERLTEPANPDAGRWASESYPEHYRDDVNASIGFAGVDMDMFTRGKVDDLLRLVDRKSPLRAAGSQFLDIGCGVGVMHP